MLNISPTLKVRQALFSAIPISQFANPGFNFRMDIKQIRRANLIVALEWEKTKVAFATKVGTEAAYISQILSTKTKAEVGNDLARAIERAYSKPHGWMDREHGVVEEATPGKYSALIAAWDLLTKDEREPILADIQRRAAHNQAAIKELAPRFDAEPKTYRATDLRKRQVHFDHVELRENNGKRNDGQ